MADHFALKLSEIAPGTMRALVINEQRIVVFRDTAGNVSALADRCSHAEVKLSRGTFADGVVTCPAHGAKFDVCSGKNLCMPAVTPVPAYAARIEGDDILITLATSGGE